jgi:hypothetical protein
VRVRVRAGARAGAGACARVRVCVCVCVCVYRMNLTENRAYTYGDRIKASYSSIRKLTHTLTFTISFTHIKGFQFAIPHSFHKGVLDDPWL